MEQGNEERRRGDRNHSATSLATSISPLPTTTRPLQSQPEGVKNAVPIIVGLTITALIGVFAPLTSAGINPARDLGPRLVAYAAGWGAPVFQVTKRGLRFF